MLLPGVIPRRRLCRCARTTSAVMTPNWEPSHQHIAVGPLRRPDGSEPASREQRSSNARNSPRHARRRPVACPRVVGLTRPSGRRSNVTVGAAPSDGHPSTPRLSAPIPRALVGGGRDVPVFRRGKPELAAASAITIESRAHQASISRRPRRAACLSRRRTWQAPRRCRCRRSSPREPFRPGRATPRPH